MPKVYSSSSPRDIVRRRIDQINLMLCGFLAGSPWVSPSNNSAVLWNSVLCGASIATITVARFIKPHAGLERVNIGLGLWLLIAPWLLSFSVDVAPTLTSMVIGLVVAILSIFQFTLIERNWID